MRWIYLFVAAAAITYLGSFIAAPAERAITHIQVADDPVARADLLVAETMTPQVLTTQLEAALKAEDDDLAESLIALAREHGIQVEPAQAQQLAVLKSHATRRALRDFADGFISGGRESAPTAGPFRYSSSGRYGFMNVSTGWSFLNFESDAEKRHAMLPRWSLWLLAALVVLAAEWLSYLRRRTV